MSVRSSWLIVLLFCVLTDADSNTLTDIDNDVLNERKVLKYANVIISLSVSTFSYVSF